MQLTSFHCHVYFTPEESDRAKVLLDSIEAHFGFKPGKFHTQPVGPHIGGSCAVTFASTDFGAFVNWLMSHRKGLTCFLHGLTGDDIADHTDYVLWLGKEWPLNLSALQA